MTDHVTRATGASTGATAVLTAAGHAGFAPHADFTEVVALQVAGVKDWQVWTADAEPPRGQPRLYAAGDLDRMPTVVARLRPGDALFIPRGAAHCATTIDSMSLHVSLVISPRSTVETLRTVLKQALDRLDVTPDLPYRLDTEETATDALAAAIATLRDALDGERLAPLLASALRTSADSAGGFVRAARAQTLLTASSALTRVPGWSVEGPSDSAVRLRDGDRSVQVPAAAADAIAALVGGATVAVVDLSPAPFADNARLARQLIALGIAEVIHDAEDRGGSRGPAK